MPTITGSVEDREQIRELYARYAIYLDSSKFEEWVNCFTEDGIFETPLVGKHAGHAALRKFCASLREKWAGAQVRHMMVNVSFDVVRVSCSVRLQTYTFKCLLLRRAKSAVGLIRTSLIEHRYLRPTALSLSRCVFLSS